MNIIERIIVPEIFKLKSPIKNIHYYSYAETISQEEVFGVDINNKYKYIIEFDIKEDKYFKLLSKSNFSNINYHNISIKDDNGVELLYRKMLFPHVKLFIHFIEKNNIIIFYVNKIYFYLIKWKIENILPPGIHLRNLTYMLLLKDGILSLHASAFATDKNKACLIFGLPNTGKTMTVLRAMEDSAYYLSEDVSVVKDGFVYSTPYTATNYHNKFKWLGPFSYFISPKIPLSFNFKGKILPKAKLKYTIIIEPSQKEEIIKISAKDVLEKILLLNKYVFDWSNDKLILLKLYYLNKSYLDIINTEKELIKYNIKNSKTFIVRTNDPAKIYDMIKSILQ